MLKLRGLLVTATAGTQIYECYVNRHKGNSNTNTNNIQQRSESHVQEELLRRTMVNGSLDWFDVECCS